MTSHCQPTMLVIILATNDDGAPTKLPTDTVGWQWPVVYHRL